MRESVEQRDRCAWHHVILTTYGSWLHGDARGFRTRQHRQHIVGDYRKPPPAGKYAELEKLSKESLAQPAVQLSPPMRAAVGGAIRERLERSGGLVVCVAVARQHVHVLVKLPVAKAREWCGVAKRHAWFVSRDHGHRGKLWGKRGRVIRITNRRRQLAVYRYIVRHAKDGAWVWQWRDRDK